MGVESKSAAGAGVEIVGSTRSPEMTLSQLVDRYMAAYAGRDKTRVQRLSWWVARFGERPFATLSDDDIFHALEALSEQRARTFAGRDIEGRPVHRAKSGKKLAPATVNRYRHALAAVLTWAIRKRLAPRGWEHPCRHLEQPAENNARVRFLSEAERERLFAACRASAWPKLYPLVLLAITTGARRGELLALRVRDINLDRAVAHVDRSKNGDRKVLPLTLAAVAELRQILPESADALVFGSTRRPDVAFHFNVVWSAALKAAKLRDFHFHDLRHSCASYLAQNGATLLEIADVLGHRQLSVTRRYSHLTTQHKAKLINRVLGGLQ